MKIQKILLGLCFVIVAFNVSAQSESTVWFDAPNPASDKVRAPKPRHLIHRNFKLSYSLPLADTTKFGNMGYTRETYFPENTTVFRFISWKAIGVGYSKLNYVIETDLAKYSLVSEWQDIGLVIDNSWFLFGSSVGSPADRGVPRRGFWQIIFSKMSEGSVDVEYFNHKFASPNVTGSAWQFTYAWNFSEFYYLDFVWLVSYRENRVEFEDPLVFDVGQTWAPRSMIKGAIKTVNWGIGIAW